MENAPLYQYDGSTVAALQEAATKELDTLRRRVTDLERLLKVREAVTVRLLRAADELAVAPRVVSVVTVHEDGRTLGATLTNGKFYIRQLVRTGWEWHESKPIPGTPAALLRDIQLIGTDSEQMAQVDAEIERIASHRYDNARPGGAAA